MGIIGVLRVVCLLSLDIFAFGVPFLVDPAIQQTKL